jgi:hypothetical protein
MFVREDIYVAGNDSATSHLRTDCFMDVDEGSIALFGDRRGPFDLESPACDESGPTVSE